ncbi:MAG: hypothetical protein ACK4J0_01920 [Candidatus Anstonellaceae archaeon]
MEQKKEKIKFDQNSLFAIGIFLSLLISLISLYFSLEKQVGLTQEQKVQLKDIANQLRKIQQKDLILTAPIKTTVYIQKEIPANEIIPENLNLIINTTLPVNSKIEAITTKGEKMRLELVEDVPITGQIPISSLYSLNDTTIKINQEIPIESKFSLTFRVSAVYGKELNEIIQKLDELGNS